MLLLEEGRRTELIVFVCLCWDRIESNLINDTLTRGQECIEGHMINEALSISKLKARVEYP